MKARINDLSRGGSGVARLDSGEVIFVPFTAPGDWIEVRIIEKKKNYSQGELVQLLEPSPGRVPAPCPHFTRCGGCSWQHIPYSLQFETKKKGLLHALGRKGVETAGIPLDELPAQDSYHYRNRIQLHGNADTGVLGFFRPGTREIVDLQACAIADARINEALPGLREQGFREFRGEFKLEIDLSPEGHVRSAWNRRHAAFGFRQVNDAQNRLLQTWISENLRSAELLFDLYGGNGNLSRPLASRFREVFCVDLFTGPRDETAPRNFHLVRQDMDRWSRTPIEESWAGKPASVILDPPREGIAETLPPLLHKISRLSLTSVILVGCDVDAFTRDVQRLIKKGFRLERLGALDLFPQTPHIESLALFSGTALN
jgi:23S rRNA (uracil1939-C5)-methyltransferase